MSGTQHEDVAGFEMKSEYLVPQLLISKKLSYRCFQCSMVVYSDGQYATFVTGEFAASFESVSLQHV